MQGLSYTTFDVQWATPPPALATVGATSDSVTSYKVTVKNTGSVDGDEVVFAYTKPKALTLRGSLGQRVPIEAKKLFGFQVILPTAPGVSNEGPRSRVLVPLPAVSWPWVSVWGSLEPPRRDGENAQKTRKTGKKWARYGLKGVKDGS